MSNSLSLVPSTAFAWVRVKAVAYSVLALLLVATSGSSKSIHCQGGYRDAEVIQRALNAGGTLTLTGTCNLGEATLTFGSNLTIQGNATLNYTGADFIFASTGSNNTVTGLTLNGGGIHLTLDDTENLTGQWGWTITNNTIRDITASPRQGGVVIENILGKGPHSTISHNHFSNIWPGGYPNDHKKAVDGLGGIWFTGGIDNVTMDGNYCTQLGGNCIKGFLSSFSGNKQPYVARDIVISNNDVQLEGRIGIEVQGNTGSCPGGCKAGFVSSDGVVVKGNYFHNFLTPIDNTFAFSLMFGSSHAQYINNSAVNSKPGPCNYRLAIALENEMNGGIVQGNTMTSVPLASPCQLDGGGSVGWQGIEASGYTIPGYTNVWSNNIYCQPNTNWHNTDGYDGAKYIYRGEFMSTSCPIGLTSETSKIALEFLGGPKIPIDLSKAALTIRVGVVSNLAIRNVEFCFDNCSRPFATKELQEFNPDFATNRKWIYAADLSSNNVGKPGSHTLTVVATDVSGSTQSSSMSISLGK